MSVWEGFSVDGEEYHVGDWENIITGATNCLPRRAPGASGGGYRGVSKVALRIWVLSRRARQQNNVQGKHA